MNECLTTPFVVINVFKYKDQFKDVSYLAGVRCMENKMATSGQPPDDRCDRNHDMSSFDPTTGCDTHTSTRDHLSGMDISNVERSTPFFDEIAYTYMGGLASPSEGSTVYPVIDPSVDLSNSQANQGLHNEISRNCSNLVQCILNDMVSVPKDLFIDRLIEMVGNDKNELEILRHELLKLCKNKAEFVYKTAQLKRRYEARTRTGESMTKKLAKDCFILFRSSQGDVNEDLFDVLNITKSQPLPKAGHGEQCSREAQCNTLGIALRESLAIIERDLITLRGELVQDIDCCRTKIDKQAKQHATLKSEMLDLRLQQQKEMYVKTQNENQQLKEKVATLQKHLKEISSNNKTVLKETLGEFKKMYEQNKNIKSDVDKNTTEIKSHIQAFDDVKRTLVSLKQLEKTVGKSKMSHENLHKEFTCFKSKVDNGCLNISRLYDEKCMGVSAIKSKVQITNTKVKDIEESLVELTALIKSVRSSTTDMRKRVTSLEKELKHYTKKSYS